MTIWLAIAILATWRVSSMLVLEDGPLRMFQRLRGLAGVRIYTYVGAPPPRRSIPIVTGVLSCLDCASVWVGLAATATWWPDTWQGWVLIPLALSTGAIVIERVVRS